MSPTPVPQPSAGALRLRRRDLGLAIAGTAAAATLPAALAGQPAAADPGASHHQTTVRLATVGSVQTGGLLNQLLASFEAQSGYEVEVFMGQVTGLYQRARDGLADLVISHFGVLDLEELVGDRVGRWPRLVLSTSFTFAAAPADPAAIQDAGDAVEAFQRIAQTESPFVVNNLTSPLFVTDLLWHAAGRPEQGEWFVDSGLSGPAAVRAAEQLGGYTLWGLHPFLAFQQQQPPTTMQAVLFDDSLLQRVIASVVVEPGRYRRVNLPGALALQEFLQAPATQGQIRRFRHPMVARPIFWPAAHHSHHDSE
ncbi:MAG: hypothetical protein GEV12_19775 [Micromonosporaceae bacterium]|nr:hypothetical protein [Micromonosporaceae bacterium]